MDRTRKILLTGLLFLTAAWLARFTHRLIPIEQRLLWPYAGFVLSTLLWMLSCLSIGHAALRLLPALGLSFGERLLFDLAVGVLLFAEGLFLVGLCGLLRPPFFLVYPLALLVIGIGPLTDDLVREWQASAALRPPGLKPSLTYNAAVAFGALGLAIVYLTIMLPDNVSFDACTYHLPIAEHYAAGGRIGKFPEGWFPGALPHLASWLFTWPFTLRTESLFERVELAAHMEFALFVATVFSTPLLVQAICPRCRPRGTWAVFFLFPGLFLYDSSLNLSADHVLAFWAVPLALAVRRMLERPSCSARAALLGLMMAGAVLTKYQAVYLLVPAALAVLFGSVHRLWRWGRSAIERRPRADRLLWTEARALSSVVVPPLALALAFLVATSSHWLANAVWHGNPVYPLLHRVFPSHPLLPDWAGLKIDAGWEPVGKPMEKLRETATGMFTFAFVPHDWATFHRDLPVFGFLFIFSLPVLLLLRRQWRARFLAGGTLLGVAIWYWTYHQDRYLQALLPWMVATTAAALGLAWAAGPAARIGVTLLVAVQVAWGGDIPWLPTHAMMGDVPAIRALRLFSSTFRGEIESRLRYDTGFSELDAMLPKDAVVLLHEEYLKLGLNRPAIADNARWQGAIDYRQLARPERVHDLLASMGATHIAWVSSHSWGREIPVSGELVFFGYVLRYGEDRRDAGRFTTVKTPARRPPSREPGIVAFLGCDGVHPIHLEELDKWVDNPGGGAVTNGDPAVVLSAAEFAVVDGRCPQDPRPELEGGFVRAPAWGDLTLWVRRN